MILDTVVIGISVGMLYGLLALAVSLIYASLDIVHFAQGEIFTFGAFVGWAVYTQIPNFMLALVLGSLATFLFAILIQKVVYNPILRQGGEFSVRGLTFVVAGFGMSILLQNVYWLIWGAVSKNYNVDFGNAISIGNIGVQRVYIIIIVVAVIVMAMLYVLLKKTQLGLAMRAVSFNKDTASLMGINVNRIISVSFGLAAVISAISGILSAQIIFVRYDMAQTVLLKAFSAAVIGGLGNVYGALLGGVMIGLIETGGAFIFGAEYKDVISFVLMILVLMYKPNGLFVMRVKQKA